MRARADQVKIPHGFGLVVETEPGGLTEDWRHGKARAMDTAVFIPEILGGLIKISGDRRLEPG